MDLKELGWGCMDWIQQIQVSDHEHGNQSLGSIKFYF
jgi:hypothetical protein